MATTRNTAGRKANTRKVTYVPPNLLGLDEGLVDHFAKKNMKLRWIRHSQSGQADTKNLIYREREGWTPVKVNELPEEYQGQFDLSDVGKHEGVIINNDVMLAMIPVEMAEARKEYFEQAAIDQESAVDEQLMQNSSRAMPILNNSQSTTTRGRKPASFGKVTES